jgi:hypothetical protein
MNTQSQTRVSRYFTNEEIEHDKDTVRITEEAIGTDNEGDVEPEYDTSSDDDDFDQALPWRSRCCR